MPTVNELLDRYVPEHLPTLARRTQIDQLRYVELLRLAFGDRDAESIKPKDIGQFLDVRKGRISRGKVVSVLANMYKLAVGRWFLVESNPCRDIIMPKAGRRTRYITDAEYAAVYALCSPRLQVAMDLALLTGQRQGDVLALKWSHIDVNERIIHIRQGKTGKRFGIYITPALEDVLVRAKRMTPALPRAYVLRTKDGDRYTSEGFRAMWQRGMKKAVALGAIKEKFTFHDIRAKAASDSPDMKAASSLLGHQDERITKSVYDRSIRIVQPLR